MSFLNFSMSAVTWSARSRLLFPFLTFVPVQLLHVLRVEDRRPGLDLLQEGLEGGQVLVVEHARLLARPRRRCRCRCPSRRRRCRRAPARGTKSLMSGERLSVRLPRRTVPIWVRLPMGFERPVRMASTPAMNVVATAPMPGSRMPSFPSAGWMARPLPDVVMSQIPPGAQAPDGACVETPECYHEPRGAQALSGRRTRRRRPHGRNCRAAAVSSRSWRGPTKRRSLEVVVEDARARQVLLGVERVEHEDAAVPGEPAVVEEAEVEIAHRGRVVPSLPKE